MDTLTSKELAEKKKAKRKVKKEKKELPNEELEQQKFIALPDSEKVAISVTFTTNIECTVLEITRSRKEAT